jgi:hypothetical protein
MKKASKFENIKQGGSGDKIQADHRRHQVPLGARVPARLKDELKAAADSKSMTLNNYVNLVLLRHEKLAPSIEN